MTTTRVKCHSCGGGDRNFRGGLRNSAGLRQTLILSLARVEERAPFLLWALLMSGPEDVGGFSGLKSRETLGRQTEASPVWKVFAGPNNPNLETPKDACN